MDGFSVQSLPDDWQALSLCSADLSTQLLMPKELLSLTQITERLPAPVTAPDAKAIDDYLNALYALGRRSHTPNISPANVRWLQTVLLNHRPQRILEIGCANGYSTLRMWQVARLWQAHLVTMDVSAPTAMEARHHCAALHACVEVHSGNALHILPSLVNANTPPFDFIFIDAQKALTLDFFVRARKLASENATIVIDDVLKFRDKMRNFYDYLAQHNISHHIHELPDDDDGVMVIGRI